MAIIGAGELGKLIAHHACTDAEYEVVGYYDDYQQNKTFNGLPIFGKCEKVLVDFKNGLFDQLFIGIGYTHMESRSSYFKKFKGIIPFANIIHSSAYIDSSCKIGEGIFILPGNVLDYGVVINDNVLLNTGGVIAHHSIVGSHSFVAPAVQIAGFVNVEESCFIGIGATILDCIEIGRNSTIGAGSVVTKNIIENSISFGSPAKIVRMKNI